MKQQKKKRNNNNNGARTNKPKLKKEASDLRQNRKCANRNSHHIHTHTDTE